MSAQPPKRRKTSPIGATPVFNRNETPNTTSRASYMSPTRASLSRFNPSLLPQATIARAQSAGPAPRDAMTPNGAVGQGQQQNMTPDQFIQRGQEALNYIMGNFNAQMQRTLTAMTGNTNGNVNSPLAQVTTPGMPSIFGNPNYAPAPETPLGEETDEQMEAMRAAIRARKEQERSAVERSQSAKRASSVAAPRRTVETPTSGRRSMPAVRTPTAQLAAAEEDEDELSLEIGRNDDPMARSMAGSVRSSLAPQSAIKSAKQIASMPSTAEEEMEIDPAIAEELEIDELSPDAPKQKQPQPVPASRARRLATAESEGLPDTPDAVRRQLEAEDHPRRGVLFSSPSKRRKSLVSPPKKRAPLAQVERQVVQRPAKTAEKTAPDPEKQPVAKAPTPPALPDPKVLAKREEKAKLEKELKQLQADIKQFEDLAKRYASDDGEAEDVEAVIKFLAASHAAEKKQSEPPALSSLLTSFLPFSMPTAPPPNESASAEKEGQFVSHEPLKEDDPLALNSLFTPLSITSKAHVPVPIANSKRVTQKHSITLASPGSLLICSLDMTVSSEASAESAPAIETLELMDLSPWAKTEIGSWVDARCAEGDVASVGYGMGRYWDICMKRAQCWRQCGKKFPNLVEGVDMGDVGDDEATGSSTRFSKRELLPYLGRSSLTLQNHEAVVRVAWKLQFDWTGEVESLVSVETALPKSWHETDTSDALGKIPATFDALMRERGVVKAVEVVGGLVFGGE